MAKAYSADMRQRVIGRVESGGSRREAAEHYDVSASTAVICQSAPKFGSDSVLMKSAGRVVLICGENQHHASIVAAILIGTQRFCCCEFSPRCHDHHDHGSCIERICGLSILRYRFAARAQSVPSSGRRPAAVGTKRRVGGHCAPLPVRRRIVRPPNLRRAFRRRCSRTICATHRAARLHSPSSWPSIGRTSGSKLCPKADASGQQRHVAPGRTPTSPRTD